MEKETKIGIRVGFEWAIGGGCVIALIAGKGTLERGSIIALCFLGGVALAFACFEHGWDKAGTRSRRIGKAIGIILLTCFLMATSGYYAWPKEQDTPTRASLHVEGLPGFSGNLVIKLVDAPRAQRQYVFDVEDKAGAWVSLYISASNLLTFSVTDTHGEVYSLEIPFSQNGLVLGQFNYLECEVGVGQGSTIMAISVNGSLVGNRIIPGDLSLGDRDWSAGTFGADRQHQQFGSFSVAEIAFNVTTFTAAEQTQMNKYIEQKYALTLAP
jgi:hypothetical protein